MTQKYPQQPVSDEAVDEFRKKPKKGKQKEIRAGRRIRRARDTLDRRMEGYLESMRHNHPSGSFHKPGSLSGRKH